MRSMWTHLLRATALLFAVTLLAGPSVANAGTYTQFACSHPDDTPAPADRWSASASGGGSAFLCGASQHVAVAKLPTENAPKDAIGELTWTPVDSSVTLAGFTLRRRASVASSAGPGTFVYRLNSPTTAYQSPDVREQCHSRFSCSTIPMSDITVDGLQGGGIFLMMICHDWVCDDGDPIHSGESAVELARATVVLRDDTSPRFSDLGGTLASGRAVWGIADLTYDATDVGAGIYRQKLTIDGRTVVNEVADSNAGRCYDAMPGWGTPYEFDYVLPCAAHVHGQIAFDLNRVTPGEHRIEASIEDAAGNARTMYTGAINVVSDPSSRTFDAQEVIGLANPLGDRPGLVANGVNASRDAIVTAYVRRVRHGRQIGRPIRAASTYPRSPTLVARVTASGRAVAGAVISLLERESGSATWRATRSLMTSQRGAVSFRLDAGPSRTVRVAYVPDSESSTFVSSGTVAVSVRPRATLKASPAHLRTGQRVRFSGRVSGGAIPSAGLALSLQAMGLDGRWLTFKSVRTTAAGHFRARYRFKATTGSVRYRFRIRVLRQGGYPFAAAHSHVVSVRVQG